MDIYRLKNNQIQQQNDSRKYVHSLRKKQPIIHINNPQESQ